jgi:hypothetical protein
VQVTGVLGPRWDTAERLHADCKSVDGLVGFARIHHFQGASVQEALHVNVFQPARRKWLNFGAFEKSACDYRRAGRRIPISGLRFGTTGNFCRIDGYGNFDEGNHHG